MKSTVIFLMEMTSPFLPLRIFGTSKPSDRITFGFIGVLNMGMKNIRNFVNRLNIQVLAVCDVDDQVEREAKKD